MFFNSRIIGTILGLLIGLILFSVLKVFFPQHHGVALSLSLMVAVVSGLVIFGALEILVFREIENIYSLFEKIKREDYSIEKKTFDENPNRLNQIKKEIFEFAEKKQQEINELKKLETFRREFLADVSHELKTPIFAAQGFIHTLIDGAVEDLQVRDRFLEKAANSLEALNVLVEDLITISQLEIGEIKMQYAHFDVRKLCEIVFEQLEEAAKKRGTKLRIYRYAPKSCYVYADKYRMGQVFTNLVMNAIKYGKEHGVITVGFNIQGDEVLVSVKDNGPGIPPNHLKRIFERFYRVDKSRSRELGGTGLGLSIVKHILEAHNAKIWVESKVGMGTAFYFKLKLGKVINENG